MVSQTEGQALMKEKFQDSGNMARVFGAQTKAPKGEQPDVAEVNAEAAQVAVAEQDRQLRGTSPQEDPQSAPPQQDQLPSEEEPVQEQTKEEYISKKSFLRRVNSMSAKNKALEEELKNANEQMEGLRQQQQPPQYRDEGNAPSYEEEGDDPRDRLLRELAQDNRETKGILQEMRLEGIRREGIAALGGNAEMFDLVNREVWHNGASGLDLKTEAYPITKTRYPDLFGVAGDDGVDHPSQYAQSGSAEPSGNRTLPNPEEDREKGLIDRLRTAGNQAERTEAGRDIMRNKIGRMNAFGDRTQASLR